MDSRRRSLAGESFGQTRGRGPGRTQDQTRSLILVSVSQRGNVPPPHDFFPGGGFPKKGGNRLQPYQSGLISNPLSPDQTRTPYNSAKNIHPATLGLFRLLLRPS